MFLEERFREFFGCSLKRTQTTQPLRLSLGARANVGLVGHSSVASGGADTGTSTSTLAAPSVCRGSRARSSARALGYCAKLSDSPLAPARHPGDDGQGVAGGNVREGHTG